MNDLRRQREALGLTRDDAARRAGVARSTLQRWEAGEPPRGSGFVRLLAALAFSEVERTRLLTDHAPTGATVALAHSPIGSPVHLGDALRAFRIHARIPQSESARRIGVSQGMVAKWESGSSVPESERLDRALAALGASPEDAAWAWSLVGHEPLRFESPLDAKDWLDENGPMAGEPREARLLAFERAAWSRAARDPRWVPLLVEAKSWRALAHAYSGDQGSWGEAIRGTLALATPIGAWDAANGAMTGHIAYLLEKGQISFREADRRYAELYERLREDQARLLCLYMWATNVGVRRQGRPEDLLDRMWDFGMRETARHPQECATDDIWVAAGVICWQRGDAEGVLEALGNAKDPRRDVYSEVLFERALHVVEPGRPTAHNVQRSYTASRTADERSKWKGVARELGLSPPR